MNRGYTVFISHAGPDKDTIAIPLYNILRPRNIHAFVEHEELDIGDDSPRVSKYAMDTALVRVFILSRETPASAPMMRELMYFQMREREARERGRSIPKLILGFYSLDIQTCRTDTLFQITNENGENAFVIENFFERVAGETVTVEEMARAMKEISLKTGFENHDEVRNEDSECMQRRRSVFIALLADKVEYVVNIHKGAAKNVTRENRMAWHASLLHGYSSVRGNVMQMRDGCREWWRAERSADKYVEENVVRHLIGAGLVREALFLVTRPQWIARQLERCGITSFERDIAWLRVTLENCSGSVSDRNDAIKGLFLVQNCVRESLSAILDNPREVSFQISARMVHAKESSLFANSIVQYAERHALKPCVKALSACVQQAETVGGKRFPCSDINDHAERVQIVEATSTVIIGWGSGRITVFDMETYERKAEWTAHEQGVLCLAVTADNRLLVSGSDDKTGKVWDMANNFDQVAVCRFGNEIWCVDVTPDNRQCVVGYKDGTVNVWELETGRCVVPELGRHETCVTSLAVSPDGHLVASGDDDGLIKVWAMSDDSEVHSARSSGSEGNFASLFLLRAFARLFHASTGEHGSEPTNVSLVATLEGHTVWIRTLYFTKDGKKLVSGSWDNTIRLWNVGTASQIREPFCDMHGVMSVYLSADEQQIFSVADDVAICVWNVGGNLERRLQLTDKSVWLGDSKIIFGGEKVAWCAEGDSGVQITDVRSVLPQHPRNRRHKGGVSAMRMTPDGTRVITGSRDCTLMVWDTATGLQVGTTIRGHKGSVEDIAVTPDGQRFISVSFDRTVRVWDLETHEQLAMFEGHSSSIRSVEISLDGKTALTRSCGKSVLMWDLCACNGSHQVLKGHTDPVNQLYLAQDGQHFASFSGTRAVLWNIEKAEMVKRIKKEESRDGMSVEEVENLVGVPMLPRLRMGGIPLGSNRYKITYQKNGTLLVLATFDFYRLMDFSSVTKTLCVGFDSGNVGIFKLELEDDSDQVDVEE